MAKFIMKKEETKWDRFVLKILRMLNINLSHFAVMINLNEDWTGKKIMIGNHSGAKGASVYKLSSPRDHYFMSWGAHQMIENYPSRWKYLYHVFYRQKLGFSKGKAFFSATTFGLVSRVIYRIAGILPIYYDFRFKSTIEHSFTCFDNDVDILIFPEDSSKGYFDDLTGLAPGFLTLSKLYYKKYGVDLPIYPMHFNRHYMKIVIGKPLYLQELMKNHTQEEILDIFLKQINNLNHKYIVRDMPLDEGDVSLEEYDKKEKEALSKMAPKDLKNINKCCEAQLKLKKQNLETEEKNEPK